jgi:hypothetical protein
MHRTFYRTAIAAGAALLLSCGAASAGGIFVGSGYYGGLGYHRGYWRSGFDLGVFVGASSRYSHRRYEDRRDFRYGNVALHVSPEEVRVYLNGIQIERDGRSELELPPGHHRLEFLRRGYETEVLHLDVEPGVDYRVSRKLVHLRYRDEQDPRLDERADPMPLDQALDRTADLWDVRYRDREPRR